MSPVELAEVVRLRLAAQLEEDLGTLDRLAVAIRRLLQRTGDEQGEWLRVRALSFELERWYIAIESTIERAVRTLDGSVPDSRSWHEDLLRTAGIAITGLRPALLSRDTVDALREVMRFRHFARHGYDREPDADRVDELGRIALVAHAACATSLSEVQQWLVRPGAGGA